MATFEGQVDVVVDVVPQSVASNPSGTFTISGIPASATVLRAFFITTSFGGPLQNATATFSTNSLGTKGDDDSDLGGGLRLHFYRFDVTSFVPGDGNYTYNVTAEFPGTIFAFGDALVVVFEDASLPNRRIVVNDGAESLQNATSVTSFADMQAGIGRLIVFTQADDTADDSNESIALNGGTILGPGGVFTANQGGFASLHDLPVTVLDGTNSMSVTTGPDHFGLHLGILVAEVGVTIDIDIKPGSDPNCFNNDGNGVIPVAILGSANFDVTQVDDSTVQLTGMAVKAVGKKGKLLSHIEDVNNDGFNDLVVQIEDTDGTFSVGDTAATLTGNLLSGTPFGGTDSICITQ